MSPYLRGERFVIGECVSLHAYHWLPVRRLYFRGAPGKPAAISVCGMAHVRGWTKCTNGRPLRFLAWMAIHHTTCRSCVRVLEAYVRRER